MHLFTTASPQRRLRFSSHANAPTCRVPGTHAKKAHNRTSGPTRQLSHNRRNVPGTGTDFEELTVKYLKNEHLYRARYRDVMPYAAWAELQGLHKRNAGIDLVAETVHGEVHAIQCKLYARAYRVQKPDIDSFFTASGKKPFAHRIIVATTDLWSDLAEDALRGQNTPVTNLNLWLSVTLQSGEVTSQL